MCSYLSLWHIQNLSFLPLCLARFFPRLEAPGELLLSGMSSNCGASKEGLPGPQLVFLVPWQGPLLSKLLWPWDFVTNSYRVNVRLKYLHVLTLKWSIRWSMLLAQYGWDRPCWLMLQLLWIYDEYKWIFLVNKDACSDGFSKIFLHDAYQVTLLHWRFWMLISIHWSAGLLMQTIRNITWYVLYFFFCVMLVMSKTCTAKLMF